MRRIISLVLDWIRAVGGLVYFALTGKTPARSWQSVVSLFCKTGGMSSEVLHRMVATFNRPYELDKERNGILGDLKTSEVQSIVSKIHDDGFCVAPVRIPESVCDDLLNFSLQTECAWIDDDMNAHQFYRRGQAQAVRYQISETAAINYPAMQKLMADESFLAIAQSYLGCRPAVDLVSLWWITDFNTKPQVGAAATMYHFDMTHIRWLNFFFYLTDVTNTSGPHTFIKGSHIPGQIPEKFLRKGYTRLSDHEVESHFGQEKVLEFLGPKGTIIMEDTRGLHKARPVQKGDRLMAQLSFADSYFGGQSMVSRLTNPKDPDLIKNINLRPRMYRHFLNSKVT